MNSLLPISDNEIMANKKNEKRFEGKGRVGSRQLLVQVLYQHQKNDDDAETLMSQSCSLKEYKRIDQEYFTTLLGGICLLYTSPSPRDATLSRMPSSA